MATGLLQVLLTSIMVDVSQRYAIMPLDKDAPAAAATPAAAFWAQGLDHLLVSVLAPALVTRMLQQQQQRQQQAHSEQQHTPQQEQQQQAQPALLGAAVSPATPALTSRPVGRAAPSPSIGRPVTHDGPGQQHQQGSFTPPTSDQSTSTSVSASTMSTFTATMGAISSAAGASSSQGAVQDTLTTGPFASFPPNSTSTPDTSGGPGGVATGQQQQAAPTAPAAAVTLAPAGPVAGAPAATAAAAAAGRDSALVLAHVVVDSGAAAGAALSHGRAPLPPSLTHQQPLHDQSQQQQQQVGQAPQHQQQHQQQQATPTIDLAEVVSAIRRGARSAPSPSSFLYVSPVKHLTVSVKVRTG